MKTHRLTHIFSALTTLLLVYFVTIYGRTSGSQLPRLKRAVESSQADIVFVGNSVLKAGIDTTLCEDTLGCRVLRASSNGSASAWWYLYSKNVISALDHPPQTVAIFFRDRFLTEPNYRTEGKYSTRLRQISLTNEQAFTALKNSSWESPMTWAPEETRERWETRTMKLAADLCCVNKDRMRTALSTVFDDSQMNTQALSKQQQTSETLEHIHTFSDVIDHSFLPHIIETLSHAGVSIVFVRMPVRHKVEGLIQVELDNYISDLSAYLSHHHCRLIDLTDTDSLSLEHFAAGDHLNADGRQLTTNAFTQALKANLLSSISH